MILNCYNYLVIRELIHLTLSIQTEIVLILHVIVKVGTKNVL